MVSSIHPCFKRYRKTTGDSSCYLSWICSRYELKSILQRWKSRKKLNDLIFSWLLLKFLQKFSNQNNNVYFQNKHVFFCLFAFRKLAPFTALKAIITPWTKPVDYSSYFCAKVHATHHSQFSFNQQWKARVNHILLLNKWVGSEMMI